MGRDGGGLDLGVPDETVEVAAERAHVLGGGEHEVELAEVERGALATEDGDRRGVPAQAVEQEPAERRVELVGELDHPVELVAAGRHAEPAPHPLAARERCDRLHRRAALHLGVRMAGPRQARGRGVDRLRRVRPLRT